MISTPGNFKELVGMFINMLSLLIPLIFGLALLYIVWKVVDAWIIHGDDPKKIDEGRQYAIVGVVALVIMSGVWGIVALLRSSFFG